jgi:hypothetical protein
MTYTTVIGELVVLTNASVIELPDWLETAGLEIPATAGLLQVNVAPVEALVIV